MISCERSEQLVTPFATIAGTVGSRTQTHLFLDIAAHRAGCHSERFKYPCTTRVPMVRPRLEVPPVEELGPKTVERALERIRAEEPEEVLEEEEEEGNPLLSVDGQNVSFIPSKLSLSLDAPLDTANEMRNLYLVTNSILVSLLMRSKPGKPHPQMLGYIKQASEIIAKYHGMTENVQNDASLQKMKTVAAMFEMNPALSDEFKIKYLKEMRAKIALLEAGGKK